jgi:hypothetical protein
MRRRLCLLLIGVLAACSGDLKMPEGAKKAHLVVDAYDQDRFRVTGALVSYIDKPIVHRALCVVAPLARQNGYVAIRFNGGDDQAMAFSGGALFGYIYHEPSLFFTGMKTAQTVGAHGLLGAPISATRATQPEYYTNGATSSEEFDPSPHVFDISRIEFDCGA